MDKAIEINEDADAATVAADVKAITERREREAADAGYQAQADAIIKARAEVEAAEADVKAAAGPVGDAEREYLKYQADIEKAENERAEIEQGLKVIKPEQRDSRIADLNAKVASAVELRDFYNHKYTEAGQVAANAANRLRRAAVALAKAEAVLA